MNANPFGCPLSGQQLAADMHAAGAGHVLVNLLHSASEVVESYSCSLAVLSLSLSVLPIIVQVRVLCLRILSRIFALVEGASRHYGFETEWGFASVRVIPHLSCVTHHVRL